MTVTDNAQTRCCDDPRGALSAAADRVRETTQAATTAYQAMLDAATARTVAVSRTERPDATPADAVAAGHAERAYQEACDRNRRATQARRDAHAAFTDATNTYEATACGLAQLQADYDDTRDLDVAADLRRRIRAALDRMNTTSRDEADRSHTRYVHHCAIPYAAAGSRPDPDVYAATHDGNRQVVRASMVRVNDHQDEDGASHTTYEVTFHRVDGDGAHLSATVPLWVSSTDHTPITQERVIERMRTVVTDARGCRDVRDYCARTGLDYNDPAQRGHAERDMSDSRVYAAAGPVAFGPDTWDRLTEQVTAATR